jgi:hypothetical protein
MGNKDENCEVTPQAIWPTAKSLTTWDGPRAPPVVHGPLGPIFYPVDTATKTAACLESQFTANDFCGYDYKRQVEARVHTLLATVHEDTPVKFRPSHISKEIQSLTLGKACGSDGIPNEYLRHFPRRSLVHLTHLENRCLRLCHFPVP